MYGSLYPFDFSLGALGNVDMAMFLTDWRLFSSRGDLLGNISLFLPYGFFGMLAVRREQSRSARFVALAVFRLFVAEWLQFLQFALPSRDDALGDVIWNAAGLAIGGAVYFRVTVARFVRPQARRRILIGSLLSFVLAALP